MTFSDAWNIVVSSFLTRWILIAMLAGKSLTISLIAAAPIDEVQLQQSTDTYFNQTFVGGSFGRRIFADDVRMIVAVAKRFSGRPVQVIWSREEMMRQGRYRNLPAARFRAAIHAAHALAFVQRKRNV